MVGKRRPELLDDVLAGLVDIPVERNPGGFDDAHGGIADLRSDPVPRDEGYRVPGHGAGIPHVLIQTCAFDWGQGHVSRQECGKRRSKLRATTS